MLVTYVEFLRQIGFSLLGRVALIIVSSRRLISVSVRSSLCLPDWAIVAVRGLRAPVTTTLVFLVSSQLRLQICRLPRLLSFRYRSG